MRIFLTVLLVVFLKIGFSQIRTPIWCFPSCGNTISGIAIGLAEIKPECRTNVNGIRLELIGLGIGIGFAGFHPSDGDTFESSDGQQFIPGTINGINLSLSGTIKSDNLNGLTIGGMAQILNHVNGLMLSIGGNISVSINGVQGAFMGNEAGNVKGFQFCLISNRAESLKGVQIGLFNKTEKIKGIQIGKEFFCK